MKAAKLQDQPPDLNDGENLSSQDTEIVERSKTDDDLANQRTQENFIHSTTLPYSKELETAKRLCETGSKDATAISSGTSPGSAVVGMCHAQTSSSHDADQYLPDEICHIKFRTPPHGSNIHAVHNAYKSVCQDPNCHCSPAKLLTPHSPNMEGNCSCLSCLHQASIPRVVHHNTSVPYLHPANVVGSSSHLHPPGSGVFYSPQHSYLPQKPFFQSPYDHEWSRYTNPAFSAPNMNHAFSNPFHSYSPKKLPSPLWSSPNKQEYRHGGGQSLTLPLARSTIVSLLKRGRCDSILRLLDGPLHDESSPLYPIALNTVLEILDVVEKEFATAYTSDRKIKGDIHHLANFVKSMTNATVSPSSEENVAQAGSINSNSLLVKAKLDDNHSVEKTDKSPAVTEKDEVMVYETAEVNDSVVGPSKPPALGTEVTPSVPTKRIFTTENTREGTTVKVSDQNAEESRPDGMSTDDRSGANGCEPKVGGNEKNACVEGRTEVEKIPENLSNFERSDVEKDTPSGCSSINCEDEQNASANGVKGSCAAEIKENTNGSHKEKVEKEKSKSVFISKDSERPMPVLENELELQKLFVCGESKIEIDDTGRPLDSDIDALLDQTLMEADQAKSKVVHKVVPSKTPEDPSTSGPSDYRGKGYKIRAVSSSDKNVAKVKAPVKTFAQIRETHAPLICGSQLDHDIKLKADQKPTQVSIADSVTMPTTDLNGNIVESTNTSTEVKISNETSDVNTDIALREGTPDLGRCPSNPLSPSCSDSLDSTDFKSFLEKSRGRTSIGSVSNENDSNGGLSKSSNSALSLLDNMRKLPLPKEPIKQGSFGKPLIAKSFHGKLLLQKHSKDDPHPIPLEITDSDFIPRDPRLSLSNLMEIKVNYEFSLLQWEDNQTASQKLGTKPIEFPLNQSVINVRDPRIRRRLSEDVHLPVLNGCIPHSLVGMSVLTPNFPNVQNSNTPDKSKTSGHYVTEKVEGKACSVLESENSSPVSKGVSPSETIPPKDSKSAKNGKDISSQLDISNSAGSSLKETQNYVKGNITLTDAETSSGNKILDNSNGDQVAPNTTADSFEQEQELLKSAIHSIRKTGDIGQLKKKDIPEIASSVSSCNISEIDKMDTVVSFREALDVLKDIKSELMNNLEKCGSKIENIGKDKIAKLCSKVKLLRQTCEVGLLSTEVQRKKASGTRFRDLCGLLEDHFILIADLTILGVFLKTWNTDVRDCREGLPEFKKGVFTRRTVPCFNKLEKWLKNRYKLDGFENEKLLNLVSMISQSGDGKRSRSRSSSTGSSKHKRKKARTDSKDDEKSKKKHSKKSDHGKDPPGVESPVKDQTKRPHSPSHKNCGPNSKRSKDGKVCEGKVKPDTPAVATSSDSDTSNEILEQSPSTKSGSRTPVSEAESPPQKVEKNASKQKVHENTDSQGQKAKKLEGSSQRKQSVSVNSGIQDIQEDMEQIKKSVLSVFRKRSTSSANRCLGELTEISHKAHTQLEDENKTYTSLKNVSKDTKAKFHDVIKGIQRIIVDCEILVYSLSSSASKVTARETKDKIWENAQKSSHKPSYEEELALLLSLRKTYLNSDLWRYIKTDVDDRIDSLQKKCRSRDIGGHKCASSSMDYASVERPTSWITATVMPCEQVIKETRLETPLPMPVADYDRRHEVGFHGAGAPFSIDYHGSYLTASDRSTLMELPNDIYTPPSNRPFGRDGYHPNGAGVPREPYQPMTSFLPRDDHMKYDWRREYDDEYDTWGIVRRNPLTTDIDYGGRHFTPPPAI